MHGAARGAGDRDSKWETRMCFNLLTVSARYGFFLLNVDFTAPFDTGPCLFP